jgi:hypothetical protein
MFGRAWHVVREASHYHANSVAQAETNMPGHPDFGHPHFWTLQANCLPCLLIPLPVVAHNALKVKDVPFGDSGRTLWLSTMTTSTWRTVIYFGIMEEIPGIVLLFSEEV